MSESELAPTDQVIDTVVENVEPTTPPDSDQATESEAVEKTPEEKEAEVKQKRDRSAEGRIAALAKRAAELQRENDEIKQRYAKPEPVQQSSDDFPDLSDYDDVESWQQAVAQQAHDKAQREYENKVKHGQQSEHVAKIEATFNNAVSELSKFEPDAQRIIDQAQMLYLPNGAPDMLAQYLVKLGADAPRVVFELFKDHDAATEFTKLDPLDMVIHARDLGLKLKQTPLTAKASSTHAPINPVSANTSSSRNTYELSDKEFLAAHNLR